MRIAVPHSLTRAQVRKRLKARTDEIAGFIPGAANVRSEWADPDHLDLVITVMGKDIDAAIEVEDHEIVVDIDLPRSLALFANKIRTAIQDKSTKLLA